MMISPNVILDIINKLIICKSSIKKIMKSKVLSYLDIYSSIPKVYINQQSPPFNAGCPPFMRH